MGIQRKDLVIYKLKMYIIPVLLLAYCQLFLADFASDSQPLGYGANSAGGSDGTVLYVTNLDDAGRGSFRWACESEGARKVVFKVSGIIPLKKSVVIRHPQITIDGTSAPGEGILINGAGLKVKASEVIIRGLRIRPGKRAGKGTDAITIVPDATDIYNVLIDHCSFSWATDENVGINARNRKIRNVTIQNCIIAEGLLDHSMGLLFNTKMEGGGVDSLTIIQNLFAHNSERNPMVGAGGSAEVINNLIYNWQYKASDYYKNSKANIVCNYWKPGLDTKGMHRAIELLDEPSVFLRGNIGPNRDNITLPEANLVNGTGSIESTAVIPESGTSFLTATEAYDYVLNNAGAFPRDSTDRRIIESVKKGTGKLLKNESEVEGFKNFHIDDRN